MKIDKRMAFGMRKLNQSKYNVISWASQKTQIPNPDFFEDLHSYKMMPIDAGN